MSDDVGNYFASKAAALSAGKAAEQAAEEVARSEIAARRAAATAAFNDVAMPHLESAATKIAHQGGKLEHRISSTEAHSGAPNSVSFTVKTPDGRSSPLYSIEMAGSGAPAFVTYSKDQKRGASSPRSRLELAITSFEAIDDIVMDRLVKMAIDDAFAA
jgi:hypothetical protein